MTKASKKQLKKEQTTSDAKTEAMNIAKSKGAKYTKEQRKLVAKGIQEGIEQYKKQQKEKHRKLDKARKKALKAAENKTEESAPIPIPPEPTNRLPWVLLLLSWLLFVGYLFFPHN